MCKYDCIACGHEIKSKDECLVDIAPLIYNGATDTVKKDSMLLLSRNQLREYIERKMKAKDARTSSYFTIKDLLEIAYSEHNRDRLDKATKADSLEMALEKFFESINELKTLYDQATEQDEDPPDKAQVIKLCGFKREQKTQLFANFPNMVCCVELKEDETFGFTGRIIEAERKIVYGKLYCPSCHKSIIGSAFEKEMITVGMLGLQSVGKTCLINALCYNIQNKGIGTLEVEDSQRDFALNNLDNYMKGKKVAKTEAGGENICNPVMTDEKNLWSFVDIAGESFLPKDGFEFDPDAILNTFPRILQCDTYVVCVSLDRSESKKKMMDMKNSIDAFLKYMKNSGTLPPMILAITQMDDGAKESEPARGTSCIRQEYDKRFRMEFDYIYSFESLRSLISLIGSYTYVTPLTCSAYGFQPLDPLLNEERAPQPQNIELIRNWVERVTGNQPAYIDENGKKYIFSDSPKSTDYPVDEPGVIAVAKNFCNPNVYDRKMYELIGEGKGKMKKLRTEIDKRVENKLEPNA